VLCNSSITKSYVAAGGRLKEKKEGMTSKGYAIPRIFVSRIALSLHYSTQPRAWGGGDVVDFSSRSPPRLLTLE